MDKNLIIESVQLVVSVHSTTIEEWVTDYNYLLQLQDRQQGYFFLCAKKALGKSTTDYCKLIGVSQPTMDSKIKLYKEVVELEATAPNKVLPAKAGHHQLLKGLTPEEKADNYTKVKNTTGKAKPTGADIKAVMATIEAPTNLIKKTLRNIQNDINLKEILNEEPTLHISNNIVSPVLDIVEAYVIANESLYEGALCDSRVITLADGTRASIGLNPTITFL